MNANQTDNDPEVMTPCLSSVQQDIGFANSYRLESIKLLIAVAAALFAFTVSFPVTNRVDATIVFGPLAWISWASLGLSMLSGWLHLWMWELFYISYHDFDWTKKTQGAGDEYRKKITGRRRFLQFFQVVSFFIGVLAVGVFATLNTSY